MVWFEMQDVTNNSLIVNKTMYKFRISIQNAEH